ncbi:DNA recombination protein RmuC [Sphingomonas beigongshangi]|jgi:DNA recombination protein RmuC|uniref:DNA recombination protein RmuC n=1 Tax=Sphingomonas beigongshangi TaxID=2782540 RepID=UPI001AEEF9ED|nr:DNA recombination protein RmuC [Sphingomonas beigongshangi]
MGVEQLVVVAILALAVGLLLGWLIAGRRAAGIAADLAVAEARARDADLVRQARDAVERERNDAMRDAASLRAQNEERAGLADRLHAELAAIRTDRDAARAEIAGLRAQAEAFEARLVELREAKEVLSAQFGEVANRLLSDAQKAFLERADARFRQSEESAGQNLKALLQPVNERLARYEEGVAKVEAERRDAFGDLKGQIEQMRLGQERVSGEAAKLVNALRNAPKARGRWGEQQLRNVLETCGLAEHTDFAMEVSVADGDGGRLRPDAIVRVPGGKSLIIDAKVSLNAYQDAFGAVDEAERQIGLAAHAQSMRVHVNGLGNKAYWSQFDDTPEYVIMFVPGEHFLSAALEHDPTLWDFAFDKRVLLATPTNLIAIARTVSAVWRQEKLASQAREIGTLGKELYQRLTVMGGHVARLGKNLDTAMGAYNAFVGSLESQVLTSAKRFEALNIDTGGKAIDALPVGEQTARPLTKLVPLSDEAA